MNVMLQKIKHRLTPTRSMEALHLVSDLDGTWIPHNKNCNQIQELEEYLIARRNIVVTFATGRCLDSALTLMRHHVTLEPDHLVTDVGTALYHMEGSGIWVEDIDYANWVDDRWDPDTEEKLLKEGLPEGVSLQDGLCPKRRVALQVDDPAELERCAIQLQMIIHRLGLPADILTSSNRMIDVLPMDVDKGSAVSFLEERRSIQRPLFACGDSENDLGLFRIADVAILASDSPLDPLDKRFDGCRMVRAASPGPEGILDILKTWELC